MNRQKKREAKNQDKRVTDEQTEKREKYKMTSMEKGEIQMNLREQTERETDILFRSRANSLPVGRPLHSFFL